MGRVKCMRCGMGGVCEVWEGQSVRDVGCVACCEVWDVWCCEVWDVWSV